MKALCITIGLTLLAGTPCMAANRWYMPGPLGEETMPTDLPRPAEPSFEGRFIYGGEWGEKNGQGGFRAITGHTWHNIVPPEKYWATHPEYYSLNNGERTRIAYGVGQLCTTNPDVIRIFSDYCIEFFRAHKEVLALDVGANDCVDWCECENCRALDVHWRGHQDTVTDRIVTFYNQVAKRVREGGRKYGYTNRYLVFLAYNNMTLPPWQVKPDPMLVPQICRWIGYENYGEGIEETAGRIPSYHTLLYVFDKWSQLSPTVATWDYWGSWQWPWFFPNVTSIAKDMKFYKSIDVDVVYSDTAACWATQGLNIWLAAQLSFNADADVDALVEDYCKGMFHAGAPAMLRFYKVLEDNADRLPSSHTRDEGASEFFTSDLQLDLVHWINRAKEQVKDDEVAAARVQLVDDGLKYTLHYMEAYKYRDSSDSLSHAAQALLIALKRQKEGYFSDLSVVYAQNLVARLLLDGK